MVNSASDCHTFNLQIYYCQTCLRIYHHLLHLMKPKVEVRKGSIHNNGMFAKQPIKRWQHIDAVQPMSWATLQTVKNTVCNWCLLEKEVFRCSLCKCFYYCSQECQKNDWKIHKLECKMYKNMFDVKKLSTTKEITSEFVLNCRLWHVTDSSDKEMDRLKQMLALEDDQPMERKSYFLEMAAVLLENMGLEKNEANIARMMRQMNVVSINAFTIQDFEFNRDGVGIGLFNPSNYLNHECQPNCTQVYDGRVMKLIANKDIEEGEQLTLSYIERVQPYSKRSQTLQSQYLFHCFCEQCQAERMINTDIYYLKCEGCQQAQIRHLTQKSKVIAQEMRQATQGEQNKQHAQEGKQEQEDKETEEPQGKTEEDQGKQDETESHEKGEDKGANSKKDIYCCQNCQKEYNKQQITNINKEIDSLFQSTLQSQDYAAAKKLLFALRKKITLQHPYFCDGILNTYQKALTAYSSAQSGQQGAKLLKQAYILLKQAVGKLPLWYKQDDDMILSCYMRYAQLGKLCYNLQKKAKAQEYSSKALRLIQIMQPLNKYHAVAEIEKRCQELNIEISMAKAQLNKR